MRPDRYNADPTPFEAFKNMERRPIAPHLLFSQFMDADELDPAMSMAMLSKCSQFWVFGNDITPSMKREIAQVPVLHKEVP